MGVFPNGRGVAGREGAASVSGKGMAPQTERYHARPSPLLGLNLLHEMRR